MSFDAELDDKIPLSCLLVSYKAIDSGQLAWLKDWKQGEQIIWLCPKEEINPPATTSKVN